MRLLSFASVSLATSRIVGADFVHVIELSRELSVAEREILEKLRA